MATPKKRRRGRFILLGLLTATIGAIVGYRQRTLNRNRVEFEKVYG